MEGSHRFGKRLDRDGEILSAPRHEGSSGERGYALAEALVASSLAAVVIIASLMLYDDLSRFASRALRSAEQQCNVRIAIRRIAADVRSAGLNHNPDGNPLRGDEPIEGAWDGAIVIRADDDGEDPTRREDPETSLSGGAFEHVSVGNDEIVGYALARSDGASGGTLTFHADVVGVPRDGVAEPTSLPRIETDAVGSPVTIYRFEISASGTTANRRPVADRIESLAFRYHDRDGGTVVAPGGDDDPLGVSARAGITGIDLTLTGAAPDGRGGPGPLVVRTRITPRSLGLVGAIDPSPELPGPPGSVP